MAKYFCGISANNSKYTVSIVDDNLNVIFMDELDLERLTDLLKKKSISVIAVDAPLLLYFKYTIDLENKNPDKVIIKKRSFDNMLSNKNLLKYSQKFSISKEMLDSYANLLKILNTMGFNIKEPYDTEKSIIETYSDTIFTELGCTFIKNISEDEIVKQKLETLKHKGVRLNNFFRKTKGSIMKRIDILCQAYTGYLYYIKDIICLGSSQEGILVIPVKKSSDPMQNSDSGYKKSIGKDTIQNTAKAMSPANFTEKNKDNCTIAEYCGAQYLYTNMDGVIRTEDLRPIKSYRPFEEIYEMKQIKLVQVIIGTTDGLRRVKANLIPYNENSTCFRAANEEDKKKLDGFWGIHGDRRGYLIKFNKVEVVKA